MSLSIQITQQFTKLGLNITKPQLEMQSPPATLQISSQQPLMTIDQGPGAVQIDGEDAHSALGHKPTSRFMADMASQVRQMVVQIIGDISEDGYKLSQTAPGKRTTEVDIAMEHYLEGPEPIQDVGPFSSDSVHVSYTPHPTTINWTPPQLDIEASARPVQTQYTPGKVSIYVAQPNGLQIDVRGHYLNMTL